MAEVPVDLVPFADQNTHRLATQGSQQDLHFQDPQSAKDHIELIRKNKGLDLGSEESEANAEDLEQALVVLSDQLYSQPTHFLLEFIQNADDNSYEAIVPKISFSSTPGHLRIDCNETGFTPNNVDAICRIGKSTKADRSKGFIGEKGIGFKSVFKIADIVWISSNAYNFKFDRNTRLGMIAPIWEEFPCEVHRGISQFYLQFTNEGDSLPEADLTKQLQCFDGTLLLFLRKIKKVAIFVDHSDWKKKFTNDITRTDTVAHGGELITIKKSWMKAKRADETSPYLMVRHSVNTMPIEHKRLGMQSSEVVIAFPFLNSEPAFYMQKAYAFLPIRDSGFKFLLQADFILIANREDIEKSNPWNDRLLIGLAECFIEAVNRFNSAEGSVFRYSWLGYLRNIPKSGSNSFASVADEILSRLKDIAVLESQTGDLVRPVGSCFVPSTFRDDSGHFVIDCPGQRHKFISADYEAHDKEQAVLRTLGVDIMTFEHFYAVFKNYMVNQLDDFRTQTPAWHSLISKILCDGASDLQLQSLVIIPIQTGEWISKLEGQAYFHTAEALAAVKVPEGIPQLFIVDQNVSEDAERRRLLERLGVKNFNQAEVCRLIRECHASSKAPELAVDAYISHATYLFEAIIAGTVPAKGHSLWVLDKDGRARISKNVYLDTEGSGHRIGALLSGPCWNSCLLHPGYLLAYKAKKHERWIQWLESHLDIKSRLRIAFRGEITSEFYHLVATQPSTLVLEILLDSWIKDPKQLTLKNKQQLGRINVQSEAGEHVHLNKTCLPLPSLKEAAPSGIHYLQLDLPMKPIWTKLHDFGVVVKPDLAFHIQCLSLIQREVPTKAQITRMYKNIDSHWLENPALVNEYFSKTGNRAIWVPNCKKWFHRNACVWESAPGFRPEIVLANVYPELQSLFFHRLKMPSATIGKVVEELQANTAYNALDLNRRKVLMFTLSEFLRKTPRDYSKLHALKDVPVMPTADSRCGTSGVNIVSLNKSSWYFADQHRYYKGFRDKLTFAAFGIDDYIRLEPLDRAIEQAWSCGPHRLSASIVEERDLGPCPSIDIGHTNTFRQKAKYLKRITRVANTRRSRDLERKLQHLNFVTVYVSPDMIVKPYIVRGQIGNTILRGDSIPGRVMLRSTSSELQVCLHPQSLNRGRLPQRDINEELCKWCSIADEKLKRLLMEVLLEEDTKEIQDIFSRQNVGGFDVNDFDAVSIELTPPDPTSSSTRPNESLVETRGISDITDARIPSPQTARHEADSMPKPVVSSEATDDLRQSKVSYQGYSSSTALEISPRELSQAAKQAQLSTAVCIGARENLHSRRDVDAGTANSAKKLLQSKGLKPNVQASQGSSPHKSHDRRPALMSSRDQSREESIGAHGEQSVFNVLKNILCDAINETAWTSELRHKVSRFGPWKPRNMDILYSDFTVRDESGKLADWMLANKVQIPADWVLEKDKLLYHIEVKSTAKKADEPFFMSHLQMDKARHTSEADTPSTAKEVFVIFRVYDLDLEADGEPGLDIFCDPWALIRNGDLKCQTQEWKLQRA